MRERQLFIGGLNEGAAEVESSKCSEQYNAVSRQTHLTVLTITITIYYYYFNWIKHGLPRTVSLVSVAGMAVRVCSMLKQNKIEISFFRF